MRSLVLLSFVAILVGCDAPVGSFATNHVWSLTLAKSRDAEMDQATEDVAVVVESLFGTPDEPKWPIEWMPDDLGMNVENLARAAGPVSSEKDGTHKGLFREHCVTCHALNGSGAGPASVFQNPYPRDFRPGVFKWKSTVRTAKPTRDDLLAVLHNGVAGSGMPSFALIDPNDLNALVDYVVYLSIRGEIERSLMAAAVDDLGYGAGDIDDDAKLVLHQPTDGGTTIASVVESVSRSWSQASDQVVQVPSIPTLGGDELASSIQRGEAFFHGQIANCVGCHGQGGAADLVTLDYDDWAKEYSTRLGLSPADRDAMRPFKKAGAPTPRLAKPRRLTLGVFRGGGDAETLYRRITQGIAGTPMPSVAVAETENGTGLTASQIADLVRYVQSLSGAAE
ncbi:Cytochrome c [Rubripirellula amarantea]|uniref:Cytochrome c n=1 Tax=Rubripirellula amarantea TaxID=2527999 RepID=A0A5C5WSP9_9BACT|nr:c-type cytochrome [Rubripirellula amarantea]TWT53175.1 Cytochrome c [Rubripirellula amarantea]